MSQFAARRLALCSAALIAVTPTVNAEVLSLTSSGPELDYVSLNGDYFIRSASSFDTFWDFCNPYCNSYYAPDTENYASFSTSGSVTGSMLTAEGGVTLNSFPVDLYTRTFPASNTNNRVGQYIYNWTIDPTYFLSAPQDKAFGFRLLDTYLGYDFFSGPGANTYNYVGVFDSTNIPSGYDARIETVIDIVFSTSWINSDGRPEYFSATVYRNRFDSTFSESIDLTSFHNAFPELASYGGGYTMNISNEFTFMKTPTTVPVPPALPLLATGIAGMLGVSRRAKKMAR